MGKKSTKSKNKKIFIEPLEQRIMLDGAGASTFLDLIDERSQGDSSNKTIYDVKKFKEIKSEDGSKDLPFTNVPRDQLKRKQIVFIDKQVPDYEKLDKRLSGKLSESSLINIPTIFIGPQTALIPSNFEEKIKIEGFISLEEDNNELDI